MSQDKQIKNVKTSDNTAIEHFNRFTHPASSTSIDRYVFANTWTKGKKVLDAATGQGYGAGILLSLGAESVFGIDTDIEAIENANNLLQSPKAQFKVCDIFDLEKDFKENEFEVCVSLETFEHLPPERIDEYLQSIKKVTSETLVISTPQRKTEEWVYNGGTHLYEYSATEFIEVLKRNFPNDEIGGFGIIEVPLKTDMPDVNYQWGSNITTNLSQAWVMVGVVTLNK
jgi:cyclopropane fatty-acyl-phospholipid synthase-like methyltransferase|tara:strand:+ start:2450 stop:3133 length:684 start_codon:yes stop_codon:yes gene_type:complete